MTPLDRYELDVKQGKLHSDNSQRQAIRQLNSLYQQLIDSGKRKLSALFKRKKAPKGVYLWGSVGRGKTYLMDIFYRSLPIEHKMRMHFHEFMRMIHADLRKLQGKANPLQTVAEKIATQTRVLCFDEFVVIDIADAMILGELMKVLFAEGVALVTTSNFEPDKLYHDGLQRDRFEPAIEAIKKHCKVVHIDSGVDYRQNDFLKEQYHVARNTHEIMQAHFEHVSKGTVSEEALSVLGRKIPVVQRSDNTVWFKFKAICDGARSQNDYLEIAGQFDTVLVSDIPHMTGAKDNQARRFINLVDVLYDKKVNLILSATVPMDQLYTGKRLAFEFQRTLSRLQEMLG